MRKLLFILLFYTQLYSAVHYCSPSGSASWANSTNISTPCSWSTAFSNATAGDLVYFRGGDYNLGSAEVEASNNGTANDDAHRVIFKSYPGEMANLYGTTTHGALIWVDGNYQTYDSLSMHVTINNAGNGDRAVLDAGDWHSAQHLKVLRCHLHIVYTATLDNVDCIILEGTSYSDYALIQYNDLEGPGAGNGPGGIIIMTVGSAKGTKILNNEIHNTGVGIYCKHINGDVSFATGAEWAYNYIHHIGPSNDGGFLGIPAYINIHDNLIINTTGTDFGINGGGPNGTNSLLNHNTFEGGWFRAMSESGGMINYTIKNNIFLNREIYGGSGNTFDYNMWESVAGIGAHDQGNTSPTYTGGSSPTTILGYALTAASNGYKDGDDGKDLGCDVTLVGRSPGAQPPEEDTSPPIAATSFIATAIDSSGIKIQASGFAEWDTCIIRYATSAYPTSITDGSSVTATNDSTTINNDNFTLNLLENTIYYVRMFLGDSIPNWIAGGSANSDTIRTPMHELNPPTAIGSYIATAVDSSGINIKASQFHEAPDSIRVQYNTSAYPAARTTGTNIYAGHDTTAINNDNFTLNLLCNTVYYTNIWLMDSLYNWQVYATTNKDTLLTPICAEGFVASLKKLDVVNIK